jgi:DNA-directed RNA polymerase subunit RPC12/RpoP
MDIVFNCPNCEQELAVDQSGAGSQIECPACGEHITIPATGKTTTGPLPAVTPPPVGKSPTPPAPKPPLNLKVPVRDKPSEVLIDKPRPPLEVVQKGAGKRLRIHTIRRAQCMESGHDHFDERVSEFLNQVTETNLISITPINYEHFDVGVQKIMTDYGVLIVFRG